MSTLDKMIFLNQMNQQAYHGKVEPQHIGMPTPYPGSPIERGSMAGLDAARHSKSMSEGQSRRAMGAALMPIFQNIGRPEYGGGLEGGLQAMNAAMPAATNAYMQQQQLAEAQNEQMMKEQQAMEHQRFSEMAKIAQLEEQKRYHDMHMAAMLSKVKRGAGTDSVVANPADIPEDAINLNTLPANVQHMYRKQAMDVTSKGGRLKSTITTLKEMKKISDENPHLSNSLSRVVLSPDEDTSVTGLLSQKLMNQKDRTAMEKMRKLNSKLITDQIRTMSGARATDIFKKYLKQAAPNYGMTKESIDYIVNSSLEEIEPEYEYAIETSKLLPKGYVIPGRVVGNKEKLIEASKHEMSPEIQESPTKLTPDLQSRFDYYKQRDPNLSDDKILNHMRSKGWL